MTAVNYLWNPINDNIVREFDDAGNAIAEYTTEPDLYGNVVSQVPGRYRQLLSLRRDRFNAGSNQSS